MRSALFALLLAPSLLLGAEAKPSAAVKVGTGIENRDVTGEAPTLSTIIPNRRPTANAEISAGWMLKRLRAAIENVFSAGAVPSSKSSVAVTWPARAEVLATST